MDERLKKALAIRAAALKGDDLAAKVLQACAQQTALLRTNWQN